MYEGGRRRWAAPSRNHEHLSPQPGEGTGRLRFWTISPSDQRTRQVTYDPKNRERGTGTPALTSTRCPALDSLTAHCTHIPGQQLIRYYGGFSQVRSPRDRLPFHLPHRPWEFYALTSNGLISTILAPNIRSDADAENVTSPVAGTYLSSAPWYRFMFLMLNHFLTSKPPFLELRTIH